ncbi:MAG TPA: 6-phospho-beta-glucosidase [Acholeplasmataceae bacterium]|jgi:6-phospho-beta-glucosidase|nr:6-phospho-beta-glucosidase [Acholeplasmataceae bacterium]
MKKIKIALIGAGSTYTPELMEGIINKKDSLPVGELYLMDIDERKLNIVGSLAKRQIEAAGLDCNVVLTTDLDESLKDANFVLAQIRVGKLPARVLDEKIPLKYGLIGQETNGIGGFFKGMRTIPEMMKIAKKMEELCPDAWLINFSNPAGMLTEALLNHTNIKAIGVCNVPINMIDSLKRRLKLENAEVEYLGLNHLTWVTSIKQDGVDYLEKAINEGINSEAMKNIPASGFTAELIKTVGAIPSSYLEYYYFKDTKLKNALEAEKSRGEVCIDIENELLEIYSNSELHTKPELLSRRGGARYSEVAINLVDSIYNDKQDIQVVNTLNNGALDFMADDDVIEINCLIGKDGPKPIKAEVKNQHIIEYMKMIKAYEKHAVNAALTGDEDEAMRALLINPLVFDYHKAYPCFQELKEAHKEYLPQFFKEEK